jgi:archaellum component FlaF (FlaF/FlaG flagellin family)
MKKRGVATILGTLIFISVLFSAIIPLQLVMQQADKAKLQEIEAAEQVDEDGNMEDLTVLYYPKNQSSNQIYVRVKNSGDIGLHMERLWIKDTKYALDKQLDLNNETTLGPYTIDLEENTTYAVKIITERGQIFSADMISLTYSDGTWYTPTLGINVYIANDQGKYYVRVWNSTWSDLWQSAGIDHDDIQVYFEVDTPGYYNVEARKNNSNGDHIIGSPTTVDGLD